MALRSINLAVNDYCNFGCAMCHIWKNPRLDRMSAGTIAGSLGHQGSDLSAVEELSITGGEPFLRDDLPELVDAALEHLPALERLFVNTNGSRADRTLDFVKEFSGRLENLYICISIDGEQAFHDRLRGAESHQQCVSLIERITNLALPRVHVVISTTLVDSRHALVSLEHVHSLALRFGCDYTFRVADRSDVYYRNGGFSARLDQTAIEGIAAFIRDRRAEDPFLQVLKSVLEGGRNYVMLDESGLLRCRAGGEFLFIQADGVIRPCIYSERILGRMSDGVRGFEIEDLGAQEPCPCCTECTIYPMLNARRR